MAGRWIRYGALGAVVLGVGAVLANQPTWLLDWLAGRHPGCLFRVPIESRVVALTVDDGPDSATTPPILDELKQHQARATFFLISKRVQAQEQLVRRLVEAGHEIGNHFTQDRTSILLDPAAFERDLEEAHAVLAPYGPLRWARPGSGWYSRTMVSIMGVHGYRCALGSVYPYDAMIPSADFSAWHILRNVRPGAILIVHDGGGRGRRTAQVLRMVLPELKRRGYEVVTLSELTAREASP
jgi:peptidoglycan/xylan/chitin deacetylase (PgdA/CDA1 family)